jgi:hypothetical protein
LIPLPKTGTNNINLMTVENGKAPVAHQVTINYDPNMDLHGRDLFCIGTDTYSVLYDLASGTPCAVITDVSNLLCGQSRSIGYQTSTGQMVEYDIYNLRIVRNLGVGLRPRQFYNDDKVVLCTDGTLYDLEKGRTIRKFQITTQQYPPEISYNCRYYIGKSDCVYDIETDQKVLDVSFPDGAEPMRGAVSDDGKNAVFTGFARASGHIYVSKENESAKAFGAVDIIGLVVCVDGFAYTGGDGNPVYNDGGQVYQIDYRSQRISKSVKIGGSDLRLSGRNRLVVMNGLFNSGDYRTSGSVLSLPDLGRIGREVRLPVETIKSASVTQP